MTELDKLEQYLKAKGIPYERKDSPDGYYGVDRHQIIVFDNAGHRLWDAVCQFGSYGFEDGLLEIMGGILVGNSHDVIGFLNAKDVIEMWEAI